MAFAVLRLIRKKQKKKNKKEKTPQKKSEKKKVILTIEAIRKKKIKKVAIMGIIGYLSGVFLTYMWFLIFATQFKFSLSKSTIISGILAIILTCGLAFSKQIRCIVVLILPNFFSAKGRSALVAYTMILGVTGPTLNIGRNVEVLSESLACGQEQLKEAVESMLEIIKRPLQAIKNTVKMVLRAVKKTVEKIEKVLKRIRDLILSILKVIKDAFKWLASIVNICNKKIGTPFERCVNLFEDAKKDCQDRLGFMNFLCTPTYILKAICYSVKFIDFICILIDFVSDAIVGTVVKKLKEFVSEIKNIFYVSVKFDHDFHFKTHASKNLTQVGKDILVDIRARTKKLVLFLGWMELLAGFLFLRIVLKAVLYKKKYLTNDRFDNNYITKEFFAIDEQRQNMGKETVFPMRRKEKRKYIPIKSFWLVKKERLKLARSSVFLLITTVQLISICLGDYGLFWILMSIRVHGRKTAGIDAPPLITVNVSGHGFMAEVYGGIKDAFTPMSSKFDIDPVPCLPDPIPPNFDRYFQIGFLLTLSWILLFFEPYGLRLRTITMRNFYPTRAKERAVWLHTQILSRRMSFVKFARRKARIKLLKNKNLDNVQFLDWLRAKTDNSWIMRKILGKRKGDYCMLCASPLNPKEMVLCPKPGCKGKYCQTCYKEMNNTCFLCMEPLEYGDFSDISEERDSSEMDEVITKYFAET